MKTGIKNSLTKLLIRFINMSVFIFSSMQLKNILIKNILYKQYTNKCKLTQIHTCYVKINILKNFCKEHFPKYYTFIVLLYSELKYVSTLDLTSLNFTSHKFSTIFI